MRNLCSLPIKLDAHKFPSVYVSHHGSSIKVLQISISPTIGQHLALLQPILISCTYPRMGLRWTQFSKLQYKSKIPTLRIRPFATQTKTSYQCRAARFLTQNLFDSQELRAKWCCSILYVLQVLNAPNLGKYPTLPQKGSAESPCFFSDHSKGS